MLRIQLNVFLVDYEFDTNEVLSHEGRWRAFYSCFNCFPTRCDLYCRQLYMFRVLTPIIRRWYSCNYSFWY